MPRPLSRSVDTLTPVEAALTRNGQGVLPPLLLMLLFLILPIIFRLLGKYSGIPRRSAVELSLMSRYYPFVRRLSRRHYTELTRLQLVVHGFLVTTLASGLTAAIPEITANPGEAVTSQRLPPVPGYPTEPWSQSSPSVSLPPPSSS